MAIFPTTRLLTTLQMQLEPGRLFSVWPRLYVRPLRNILLRVDRLDTGSIYGFSMIHTPSDSSVEGFGLPLSEGQNHSILG